MLFPGVPASAFESVVLTVEPAGEDLFLGLAADAPPRIPGPGKCLCVGSFDRLSAESLRQIAVLTGGGRQVPLSVDDSSIVREFGKIAALRFCFEIDEPVAGAAPPFFVFRWGPDVQGENALIDRLVLDPGRRGSYRTLRAGESTVTGGTGIASVTVVADRGADLHFLWYLLPVATLVTILAVRRLHAKAGDGHERGGSG